MRFYEFEKAEGSTLAVRTINRYADEVGKDSMDYEMFKKSAELLDKQMLKSLAQHIENSDTAPREYVMKKIADHDPETFKKMYGDQEGYLSLMKPMKNLTDSEIEEIDGQIEDEIQKGILPDPSQIDPITGQPLPQGGEDLGNTPTDPDLEAQGEITDAQAQKDARKAEI